MYGHISESLQREGSFVGDFSSVQFSGLVVSNHVLAHVSGAYCHVCALSIRVVLMCTSQHCTDDSSTESLFQAQDVQKQA